LLELMLQVDNLTAKDVGFSQDSMFARDETGQELTLAGMCGVGDLCATGFIQKIPTGNDPKQTVSLVLAVPSDLQWLTLYLTGAVPWSGT